MMNSWIVPPNCSSSVFNFSNSLRSSFNSAAEIGPVWEGSGRLCHMPLALPSCAEPRQRHYLPIVPVDNSCPVESSVQRNSTPPRALVRRPNAPGSRSRDSTYDSSNRPACRLRQTPSTVSHSRHRHVQILTPWLCCTNTTAQISGDFFPTGQKHWSILPRKKRAKARPSRSGRIFFYVAAFRGLPFNQFVQNLRVFPGTACPFGQSIANGSSRRAETPAHNHAPHGTSSA